MCYKGNDEKQMSEFINLSDTEPMLRIKLNKIKQEKSNLYI